MVSAGAGVSVRTSALIAGPLRLEPSAGPVASSPKPSALKPAGWSWRCSLGGRDVEREQVHVACPRAGGARSSPAGGEHAGRLGRVGDELRGDAVRRCSQADLDAAELDRLEVQAGVRDAALGRHVDQHAGRSRRARLSGTARCDAGRRGHRAGRPRGAIGLVVTGCAAPAPGRRPAWPRLRRGVGRLRGACCGWSCGCASAAVCCCGDCGVSRPAPRRRRRVGARGACGLRLGEVEAGAAASVSAVASAGEAGERDRRRAWRSLRRGRWPRRRRRSCRGRRRAAAIAPAAPGGGGLRRSWRRRPRRGTWPANAGSAGAVGGRLGRGRAAAAAGEASCSAKRLGVVGAGGFGSAVGVRASRRSRRRPRRRPGASSAWRRAWRVVALVRRACVVAALRCRRAGGRRGGGSRGLSSRRRASPLLRRRGASSAENTSVGGAGVRPAAEAGRSASAVLRVGAAVRSVVMGLRSRRGARRWSRRWRGRSRVVPAR